MIELYKAKVTFGGKSKIYSGLDWSSYCLLKKIAKDFGGTFEELEVSY